MKTTRKTIRLTAAALVTAAALAGISCRGQVLVPASTLEERCTELLEKSSDSMDDQAFDQALDSALEALRIAEDNRLSLQTVQALCAVADIDIATLRDEQAWKRADEAEGIARSHRMEAELTDVLIIKSKLCAYADLGPDDNRNEEGLGYLQEAITLAQQNGLPGQEAEANLLCSAIYVNMNRWNERIDQSLYSKAEEHLSHGEAIAREHGLEDMLAKSLPYRMRYYRQGGQYREAIDYCQAILADCPEENLLTRMQIQDQLCVLYAQNDELEASVRAHQEYVSLSGQFMRRKADAKLQEMEERYNSAMARNKIARQTYHLIVLTLLLLLAAGFIISLSARHRRIRLLSEQLARDNASKEKAIRELTEKGLDKGHIDEYVSGTSRRHRAEKLGITERESEIIRMSVQGLSTSEIAQLLHISTRTVSNHKQSVYSKMGVSSNAEMVRKAVETGLA